MIVGIPKETFPGERRVAIVPPTIPFLNKAGLEVLVERGAGLPAGYPDSAYAEREVRITESRDELFARADVILQVRAYGANPEHGKADLERLRQGQVVIGLFEPLTSPDEAAAVAAKGVTLFAMELIPRITRAQSMDVLSSMATIAGYKAVLVAAERLPKMFPMLMTAAGTVAPAKLFVVGVGVAGLQAISTGRRLGAVVQAYDVRPAVKEQVESLGAKFVEMELETKDAEDAEGYAKALGEEFYRRQRELMAKVVAEQDVVITTAAVPGKKAPLLITADMVSGMPPGSLIVDLAAERGGNCELTKPDVVVVHEGVTILGPVNLPATVPYHASQMYSKNISTFLLHLIEDGNLQFDTDDEITGETLVAHRGEVSHPRIREALRLSEATTRAGRGIEG